MFLKLAIFGLVEVRPHETPSGCSCRGALNSPQDSRCRSAILPASLTHLLYLFYRVLIQLTPLLTPSILHLTIYPIGQGFLQLTDKAAICRPYSSSPLQITFSGRVPLQRLCADISYKLTIQADPGHFDCFSRADERPSP